MSTVPADRASPDDAVLQTVRRYWGFDRLRPLQSEAIRAGLTRRDSLVVMPTGGGKSLCYQVPPVMVDRTDVVVSPLISLMKDQVDALRTCGYPAAALHSGLTPEERRQAERELVAGRCRLIFTSPERLLTPRFLDLARRLNVQSFAIDEAHCISHWGHDFRPEYRQLATLKARFPQASVHAYTATATPRVQTDVVEQLQLADPTVLVGRFDRPNLVYRVIPRVDGRAQIADILRRHAGEAAIVYCVTRDDTERLAAALGNAGIAARHYHAGMSGADRRKVQDAFAAEDLNVIVATVAFGMGIDRSNVRCVIHAAMPKTIEHYQQETGRAGRDGLEAECVLLYSAADAIRWESMIGRSAKDAEQPQEVIAAQTKLLQEMRRYCAGQRCRHRALSEYFGQLYAGTDCQACDVCLEEVEGLEDATVVAQKILSCVHRVGERFGVGHVVDVLLGADTAAVRRWGHERLSTHGLLRDTSKKALTNLTYQLIDQGLLERTDGELPVLRLNAESRAVLRGERAVRLHRPKAKAPARTRGEEAGWDGVDRNLFERLRELRRQLAAERQVPAFVIFGDVTLREMARLKPTSLPALRAIKGVGDAKLKQFGEQFRDAITAYGVSVPAGALPPDPAGADRRPNRPSAASPPRPADHCEPHNRRRQVRPGP